MELLFQSQNGVAIPQKDQPFTFPPFFLSEADATWTCDACGEIRPEYKKRIDRWVKQRCRCQKDAAMRAEKERLLQEQRTAMIKATYGWLGPNWSDNLSGKTFERFDRSRQPEGYDSALLFCDLLEGNLILHGTYGTGKTHLLAAICNHLRAEGRASHFTTAPNLFGAIQEAITYGQDCNKYINLAVSAPLLVIDDIDKVKWSEFREDKYFLILDKRTIAGLPTAISTNRLEDLESYVGGAVASRLAIGQIAVEMNGQDYRRLL